MQRCLPFGSCCLVLYFETLAQRWWLSCSLVLGFILVVCTWARFHFNDINSRIWHMIGTCLSFPQGSFGRVYLGKWRETTVAIKLLSQPLMSGIGDPWYGADNAGLPSCSSRRCASPTHLPSPSFLFSYHLV
jgi:hypothetical protein